MRYTTHLRIAALALVALVGGCKSDSSTGLGGPPASLDQVFSEASLSSLSGINAGTTPLPVSPFATPTPSSCTYNAGTFVCPTVTVSGLVLTRKFTLYDDHDVVQSQFVSGATSKVKLETTAQGTVTSGLIGFTVDESQVFTVSGLLSSTHLLNGTSTMKITDVMPPGSTITPTTTTTVMNIAGLELPKEAGGYPGAGTIDFTVTSSSTFDTPLHMQLAFNGSSKVAVTIDAGPFPSHHCTLDLSKSNPTCS
jgi:hypothetical protein